MLQVTLGKASVCICAAEPLFDKRAAIVQGKEEAPDSLGGEEEEDKAAGMQQHLHHASGTNCLCLRFMA